MKKFGYILGIGACVLLLAGCGKIDDNIQDQDNNTIVENKPSAYNCLSDTPTNSYGCYDTDVLFNGEKVTKGVWSVYTQSNTNRIDGQDFYDRYQYGFDFSGDGSAYKQEQTNGYIFYKIWGVNDTGKEITVSEDGAYAYQETFSGQNCFKVTNNGDTLKLCHESFVDQSFENAAGYYGPDVRFGNLKNYNFAADGNWTISGYGDNNSAAAVAVTLDANGSTSNGGEWGVSADGKVMEIDGVRYLVYQYLEPQAHQCIAVFELYGNTISSMQWKLCKQ